MDLKDFLNDFFQSVKLWLKCSLKVSSLVITYSRDLSTIEIDFKKHKIYQQHKKVNFKKRPEQTLLLALHMCCLTTRRCCDYKKAYFCLNLGGYILDLICL